MKHNLTRTIVYTTYQVLEVEPPPHYIPSKTGSSYTTQQKKDVHTLFLLSEKHTHTQASIQLLLLHIIILSHI